MCRALFTHCTSILDHYFPCTDILVNSPLHDATASVTRTLAMSRTKVGPFHSNWSRMFTRKYQGSLLLYWAAHPSKKTQPVSQVQVCQTDSECHHMCPSNPDKNSFHSKHWNSLKSLTPVLGWCISITWSWVTCLCNYVIIYETLIHTHPKKSL